FAQAGHLRGAAGDQESPDIVLPVDVADAAGFDGDTEDALHPGNVDLTQHPGGRAVFIEEVEHIEPVGAPVEQVRAVTFQPDDLPDLPGAHAVPPDAKCRREPALVAEPHHHA